MPGYVRSSATSPQAAPRSCSAKARCRSSFRTRISASSAASRFKASMISGIRFSTGASLVSSTTCLDSNRIKPTPTRSKPVVPKNARRPHSDPAASAASFSAGFRRMDFSISAIRTSSFPITTRVSELAHNSCARICTPSEGEWGNTDRNRDSALHLVGSCNPAPASFFFRAVPPLRRLYSRPT
jgi:hypothetical protein